MRLVCAAPVEELEFLGIRELFDDPYVRNASFLLDLTHDPFLQAFVRIDSSSGQLGHVLVIEDEELGSPLTLPSHKSDDALPHERFEERPAVAPVDGHAREDWHPAAAHEAALDLVRLDEVLPLVFGPLYRPRLDEMALVPEVRVAASGLLENAQLADQLDLEPCLLEELAPHRLRGGLAGLDAASGNDSGVLGLVDSVEDEQLVGPGGRVLARDVDDDSWSDDQLFCALILALWARLASW